MKKILLLTLSFFIIFSINLKELHAQAGRGKARIGGVVKDIDGKPISNAKIIAVFLKETSKNKLDTFSDEKGKWSIIGMGSGQWKFIISKEGFISVEVIRDIKQLSINKPVVTTLKKITKEEIMSDEQKSFLKQIKAADYLLNQKKYNEALEIYLVLYKENPKIHKLLYNIGNCYKFLNDYDNAKKYFNLLLNKMGKPENNNKVEKGYIDTLLALGDVYIRSNDYDNAKKQFEEANKLKPDDATLLYNLAEIYFNNMKTTEAINYYKKALSAKPDWHDIYIKLGYSYLNLADYVKSRENFKKFLKLEPKSKKAPVIKQVLESIKNLK
jgi:Flp pilus assembly protein TadD